jgi:hypothetical protein
MKLKEALRHDGVKLMKNVMQNYIDALKKGAKHLIIFSSLYAFCF